MEARLQAAEMWFYRRMLKVSWIEKVSNCTQADKFYWTCLEEGSEAALTGRIEGKQFLQVRQIGFVTLGPLRHA